MPSSSGLHDFWRVYDRHYDEITANTFAAASRHPEFGPLMQSVGRDAVRMQDHRRRELARRAVEGDDPPYGDDLRQQGEAYASRGITLRGWHELIRTFQQQLVPMLVRE